MIENTAWWRMLAIVEKRIKFHNHSFSVNFNFSGILSVVCTFVFFKFLLYLLFGRCAHCPNVSLSTRACLCVCMCAWIVIKSNKVCNSSISTLRPLMFIVHSCKMPGLLDSYLSWKISKVNSKVRRKIIKSDENREKEKRQVEWISSLLVMNASPSETRREKNKNIHQCSMWYSFIIDLYFNGWMSLILFIARRFLETNQATIRT